MRQQIHSRRLELAEGGGGRFEVTCVMTAEIAASAGVKPIEWSLLTNREADSLDAAAQLIDWYRAR